MKYDAAYFETTVMGMVLPSTLSTDLSLRHGATLASAEVIRALHEHKYPLTPGMLHKRGKEQINAYNPNFSRLYY